MVPLNTHDFQITRPVPQPKKCYPLKKAYGLIVKYTVTTTESTVLPALY